MDGPLAVPPSMRMQKWSRAIATFSGGLIIVVEGETCEEYLFCGVKGHNSLLQPQLEQKEPFPPGALDEASNLRDGVGSGLDNASRHANLRVILRARIMILPPGEAAWTIVCFAKNVRQN